MTDFFPRFSLIVLLVLALGSVSGCVYKQDVQQGNEITEEMLSQISPGMSKREVIKVLGFPLINDPFNRNRWDYYYSLKSGRSKEVVTQSATLMFDGDSLISVETRLPEDDDTG